jgi:hypothetical protein
VAEGCSAQCVLPDAFGGARRDLRHCGRRRQERHSISTATPSPMIASLVRRSMMGEATSENKRPGIAPGPSPYLEVLK